MVQLARDGLRFLVAALLLLVLLSMLVHYGPAWEQRDPNLATGEAHRNYQAHVGHWIYHWYTVVETRGNTHVIRSDPLTLTMTADIDVEPGDTIQVYGVLRPNRRIEPIDTVNRRSGDRQSLLAVSLVGVLATLGLLVRSWRFDLTSLRVRRRRNSQMPDLLAHVAAVYVLFSILEWRLDLISEAHLPIAMVGAMIPDLSKVRWLIDPALIDSLPISISFVAIHRLGPIVVLILLGTLLFEPADRWTVLGVMTGGAVSHLIMDAFNARADGLAPPYLYPLTWWRVPAGDLYVSAEFWPAATAVVAAVGIWAAKRRAESSGSP